MADVSVKFMHPTDSRLLPVTVDDSMTTQEAISELVANSFIAANPQGYNLVSKNRGAMLAPTESFAAAGIENDDTLRVIPATDAGE
jgi:hypothetical protein